MDTAAEDEVKKRFDPRNIKFAELKTTISSHAAPILLTIKSADRETLIKGLAGVCLFYLVLFMFVFMNMDGTVKALEKDMAVATTQIVVPQNTSERFSHSHEDQASEVNLTEGLSKYEDVGRLPVIRTKDQLTSFRAYQAPFTFNAPETRTVLSFMLKDYGLSEKSSDLALELLPAEVSFLLSPYAKQPIQWIVKAREKGHEVWLDVPVQSDLTPSSGLLTIFHHQNLQEKAELMRESLARALGYVGVGMYLDGTIKATEGDYRKLSDELYGRGLGIFEKNPKAPKTIAANAITRGAPFIQSDLDVLKMKGNNSLEELEDIALSKGHAIATVPIYPNTVKNLSLWIKGVGKVDYLIAPVSAIYDLPLARNAKPKGGSPSGLRPTDHAEIP